MPHSVCTFYQIREMFTNPSSNMPSCTPSNRKCGVSQRHACPSVKTHTERSLTGNCSLFLHGLGYIAQVKHLFSRRSRSIESTGGRQHSCAIVWDTVQLNVRVVAAPILFFFFFRRALGHTPGPRADRREALPNADLLVADSIDAHDAPKRAEQRNSHQSGLSAKGHQVVVRAACL
jgi:hypothetical protein